MKAVGLAESRAGLLAKVAAVSQSFNEFEKVKRTIHTVAAEVTLVICAVSWTCVLCVLDCGADLCIFCPNTLNGADIAFDIEGQISVVAAAIPYIVSISLRPSS
jgi:hypothetical protein